MTEEQKQEQVSKFFVGAIVAHAGHQFVMNMDDKGGVDAFIRQTFQVLLEVPQNRFLVLGNTIDLQLKSTTEKGIQREMDEAGNEVVVYDLDIKCYNDLIMRKKLSATSQLQSLVLILVVFPNDKNRWFQADFANAPEHFHLRLGGIAYWFFPEGNLNLVENKRQRRIRIPAQNIVGLDFVRGVGKTQNNFSMRDVKTKSILRFMESKGWKVVEKSSRYHVLVPPKEMPFEPGAKCFVPNEKFEGTPGYEKSVSGLLESLAFLYDMEVLELELMFSKPLEKLKADLAQWQGMVAQTG